jgi:hypothetical protein
LALSIRDEANKSRSNALTATTESKTAVDATMGEIRGTSAFLYKQLSGDDHFCEDADTTEAEHLDDEQAVKNFIQNKRQNLNGVDQIRLFRL